MIVPLCEIDAAAVAAHYDNLDRYYRELWGEHVHHGLWRTGRESPETAVRQLIDHVAERAGIAAGAKVGDIGCGYGGTSRVLAAAYSADVVGFTISPAQHAFAVAQTLETCNPTYLLRDWLANSLPSESLDACIAVESSEHMADKARFFAEAERVLKPGGRLVVCAWLARPRAARWEVRHLLEPICREGRLPGMGTAAEYQQMARDAGLQTVQYEDVSSQVRRTWSICAFRIGRELVRNPEHRRFLFQGDCPDRVFAATLLRIWLAYAVGAMQYGILTCVKQSGARPSKHAQALQPSRAKP
jgi:tocopherol O-methyltransferase